MVRRICMVCKPNRLNKQQPKSIYCFNLILNTMKRLFFALGLSVTILLSAAFAQSAMVKQGAAKSTSTKVEKVLAQKQNPKLAERFAVNKAQRMLSAAASVKGVRPSIKHVATAKSEDPTKTIVKLVVGACWDDGSGYQILMDSKAKLCDDIDPDDGLDQDNIRGYYDLADVTVPENASPVVGTTSVLDLEEDETTIDPGVYDVLVVNPSESNGDLLVFIAGGNSILDDFEFEAGYTYTFYLEIVGMGDYCAVSVPFDMTADKLTLPAVSCTIENEAEITLDVTNNGTADVENYKVWYASVSSDFFDDDDEYDEDFKAAEENKIDTVYQIVTTKLEAGKSATITFTQKLAVQESDSLYVILAGVLPLAKEIEREDNTVQGSLMKKDAVKQIPYEFDLEDYDLIPTNPSDWVFSKPDGENYPVATVEAYNPGTPLVSRCIKLEAGKQYRLSYEYYAGMTFFIWAFTEDYHVGFGLTSEPMEDWDTIMHEEDIFIDNWTVSDITLTPKIDGEYAFYFQADLSGIMGVRNLSIKEIAEKDIRLNAFSTGMPRLIPAEHINGTYTASATVQNRGKLTIETAEVSVMMGTTEIGKAEFKNFAIDSIITKDVALTVSGLKLN
ncbi:MAG: DUF2436 domain-containing protein, partial [Bacteroides sp.]|nr:DUF2436 domain-containing protein [Bacteroides sp.]